MAERNHQLGLLEKAVSGARKAGCDAAETVWLETTGESASVRLGKPEHVERPSQAAMGLRVFIGRRSGSVSTSNFSGESIAEMVERAVAMARFSPKDRHAGLAERKFLLEGTPPDLDLQDSARPDAKSLQRRAAEAEAAALAVDGISNSEGAEAGWHTTRYRHLTSSGLCQELETSLHSLSAIAIAGKGAGMERDYDFTTARHFTDLVPAAEVGKRAGERTLARLNPKRAKTGNVPVIFDKRVSATLLGHLAAAANGRAVARGTTFLADKLGKPIFNKNIAVIDDPLRKRGLASAPFDGEGVARSKMKLVADGALEAWILDCHSARELGLETNGHAPLSLSFSSSPSPTNLYMENGKASRAELVKGVSKGLLVTELIGMGVNTVTGDYSRGASGFWIENGEIAYPVNEVTIAGNLADIFANLTPADDLEFKRTINAPTVVVEGMMVAGS